MTGKRIAAICTGVFLTAGILTACSRTTTPETIVPIETEVQTSEILTETSNTATESEMITEVPDQVTLEAYIQEIDGKILILADKDGGLYQMDTDSINIQMPEENNSNTETEKGENQVAALQLQPGMALDIVYSGILMRNIPATIPQVERVTVVSDREDPYAFYRTVLQEIWAASPELNEGIEFVALDLSDAENISENQKYVLEYVMRTIAQCEVRLVSDDQLEQEGILADDPERFVDVKGMLISIDDEKRSDDQIMYDAEKWVSETAEVEWDDHTARYENGSWTLTGR